MRSDSDLGLGQVNESDIGPRICGTVSKRLTEGYGSVAISPAAIEPGSRSNQPGIIHENFSRESGRAGSILDLMLLEDNLEFDFPVEPRAGTRCPFAERLLSFREFGKATRSIQTKAQTFSAGSIDVPTYVNEFWTARQRAANSLHEISYRACFKPQLPRFFIERLTEPDEVVYDPLMGRGTTVIEAALLGRVPCGCDINPLSSFLTRPRLNPPTLQQVAERLKTIDFAGTDEFPEDLLVFYHPETLREICSLKKYLLQGKAEATLDAVDEWIWMVALNRLTGHSPGFFSVYTLPPNQAVSIKSQRKINESRNQTPPRRKVPDLICRKTRSALSDAVLLSDTADRKRERLAGRHLAAVSGRGGLCRRQLAAVLVDRG